MTRFVEGTDRGQRTLFPECVEDWICEDNPVRAVEVFVEGLELAELGFNGVEPELTGPRPFQLFSISALIQSSLGSLPASTGRTET